MRHKPSLLALAAGLLVLGCSDHGNDQGRDESGMHEGAVEDTLTEGWMVSYYDNGLVKDSSYYVQGELDSLQITYNRDQNIIKECHWKNGVLHGDFYELDYEDSLACEGKYVQGELDGAVAYYDLKDGNLVQKQFYRLGEKVLTRGFFPPDSADLKGDWSYKDFVEYEIHDVAGCVVQKPCQLKVSVADIPTSPLSVLVLTPDRDTVPMQKDGAGAYRLTWEFDKAGPQPLDFSLVEMEPEADSLQLAVLVRHYFEVHAEPLPNRK